MEVEESERNSEVPLEDNRNQECYRNTEEISVVPADACETDGLGKNGSNYEESPVSASDNGDTESLQNHIVSEMNCGDSGAEKTSDNAGDVAKTELNTEDNVAPELNLTNQKENEIESQESESDDHRRMQDSHENIVKDEHNGTTGDEDGKTRTEIDSNSEIKDSDDIENPQFENAPNISADESQEDHSQALDPFDALLKDTPGESVSEERIGSHADTNSSLNVNIDDDDNDDDHHADAVDAEMSHDADHDEQTPDETLEESDSHMQEITDEPGADEEVCLLPDTEREISEADKAKAEQVLAEKRKQAEELAALQIPKFENEVMETEESAENEKEAGVENNEDASDHLETSIEETNPESEADKEKENESDTVEVNAVQNNIHEISAVEGTCVQCSDEKLCKYRFLKDNELRYICNEECLQSFQLSNPGQYTLITKKYVIEEIDPSLMVCSECEETLICYFYYNFDGEDTNYCSMKCLESMMADEKDKYVFKRRKLYIHEVDPKEALCEQCQTVKTCYHIFSRYGIDHNLCNIQCIKALNDSENNRYMYKRKKLPRKPVQNIQNAQNKPPLLKLKVISNATDKYLGEAYKVQQKTPAMVQAMRDYRERSFIRKCIHCNTTITGDEKNLVWETMDFCNDTCLSRYQNKIGSKCANCRKAVMHTSLGKYCVRFGYDIRQFCNSGCLEEFKKGLKICCYCQRDISTIHEGFLAPVGDKGQFKDFCSQICMEKFDQMSKNPVPPPVWYKCAVCTLEKPTTIEVEVSENCSQRLCSEPCFAAFKFVNSIVPDQCRWCKKYFERTPTKCFTIYDGATPHCFCTKLCMNVYISNSRHIVPCNWCKVKKYNFDMIRRNLSNGQSIMMCSLNCLNLYQVSVNAVSSRRIKCDMCKRTSLAQYHLTMSDATVRNFCTYQCVMSFQGQYTKHAPPLMPEEAALEQSKAVPTGAPRRTYPTAAQKNNYSKMPESKNSEESSNAIIVQVDVHHRHCSQLSASITTTNNVCVTETQATSDLPSIDHYYPKTAAERMKEYRARKKKENPLVNHLKRKKSGAERAQEYRARKKAKIQSTAVQKTTQTRSSLPVISNVQSLAATPPPLAPTPALSTRGKSKRLSQQLAQQQPPEPEPPQQPKTPPPPPKPPTPPPPPPPKIYNHVLVKTLPPTEVANKSTMSKPMTVSKGVSCRPHPCTKECQTDSSLERRVLIPVPVPIYVPVPCAMYSLPFPVPVPIPIPIPTPVFIPTTRNSAKGIMKEISKIHDKMPTDPFEAELLMMAEMVAGDKKKDQSDSETDEENAEEGFSPVAMDGNNAFGEDMLQMALKMASDYEDTAVDLESAMTANTITPSSHPGMPGLEGEGMHHHQMMVLEQQRAVAALRASAVPRKRPPATPTPPRASRSKRRRAEPPPQPQPEPPREPAEKPDANMCLKYTFGVNAWKQWVMTKNAEIENSSVRRKPFKSEILQLTADELNYSLCLFVKEVRKPNGSEYAPDTIYYLVLGIQQYLFENGRIDNIFTDPYYEKFTDCLDEVARKFSVLYNDSQYIVTRVEEEHLWESKQLGAHSPHVLLSTLMFFNTKHFNLVTVEEHMQLSFSHIMKHWKRNPNQPGQAKIPGSRNVLLRFYPPQSALEANSRKKKVYEQQENEENPLRCPVKLYEFYISKCPESVRTRNDVFYLQPERSCVPDSPVWYSTQPLSREALAKMLHRVKMVKEINIALLTS